MEHVDVAGVLQEAEIPSVRGRIFSTPFRRLRIPLDGPVPYVVTPFGGDRFPADHIRISAIRRLHIFDEDVRQFSAGGLWETVPAPVSNDSL